MKQFQQILEESVYTNLGGSRGHYRHPEELFIDHGKHGAVAAHKLLHDTLNNRHPLQKKGDGSLAFHIVTDEHGRKGVATKSIDNKNAKINYTHEDIEKNHGHAPGLVHKLKTLLDNAHKISGNKRHISGEFLFTPDEVHKHDHGVSFKPNTIKNVTHDPHEVKKIQQAKLGVAVHSAFDSEGHRQPLQKGDVKHHKDVYHMDLSAPKIKSDTGAHQHMAHLASTIRHTPHEAYAVGHKYGAHFKAYINQTVRTGSHANTDDFISHVKATHQKGIDAVKTEKSKAAKTEAMHHDLKDLHDNRHHLDSLFKLHHATVAAKNHIVGLIDKADSHGKMTHHLEQEGGGYRQTGAEGWTYDSSKHHTINTLKLVNREGFSKANFNLNARFKK